MHKGIEGIPVGKTLILDYSNYIDKGVSGASLKIWIIALATCWHINFGGLFIMIPFEC